MYNHTSFLTPSLGWITGVYRQLSAATFQVFGSKVKNFSYFMMYFGTRKRPSSSRIPDKTYEPPDDEAFYEQYKLPQSTTKTSPEPQFTILVNKLEPRKIRRTTEVGLRLKQPLQAKLIHDWPEGRLISHENLIIDRKSENSSETNSTEENLGTPKNTWVFLY